MVYNVLSLQNIPHVSIRRIFYLLVSFLFFTAQLCSQKCIRFCGKRTRHMQVIDMNNISVHATTSGYRSISAQFMRVTDHVYTCTVKMSDQGAVVKRRSVLRTTVDKWIAENDKALNTTVWLKYNTDPANCTRVISLKCSICTRFKDRLIGRRNFSSAFVDGSGNLRASSFKDHAASDMHSCAMLLLKIQVRLPLVR